MSKVDIAPVYDHAGKVILTKSQKDVAEERRKKFMEEEKRNVKGIFRFYENPGGSMAFKQKKYKEIPVFEMTLLDGMEYTLPLWVANWLNGIDRTAGALSGKVNTCSYPIHEHSVDKDGKPLTGVGMYRQRCAFQYLDFEDGMVTQPSAK